MEIFYLGILSLGHAVKPQSCRSNGKHIMCCDKSVNYKGHFKIMKENKMVFPFFECKITQSRQDISTTPTFWNMGQAVSVVGDPRECCRYNTGPKSYEKSSILVTFAVKFLPAVFWGRPYIKLHDLVTMKYSFTVF